MKGTVLQEEMDRGAAGGVFPGGVLLVARGPEVAGVYTTGVTEYGRWGRPVVPGTVYDLASLTKILSTTMLFMIYTDHAVISPDIRLSALLPGETPVDKAGLTLGHLLAHASGWPAWRPFYEAWGGLPAAARRPAAARDVLREPLEHTPGEKAVYSDLNFILLGLLLEQVVGARQEVLFDREVAGPLHLSDTGYRPLDGPARAEAPGVLVAATEDVPRRGGVIRGQVHDDNAAALFGVAGHAGLFGTAEEVWSIFKLLRRAYWDEPGDRLVSRQTVQHFWRLSDLAPDSTWALGFDTPSAVNSSAGRLFSRQSLGHLGYTGTSLWYDPVRDLTAILLTNRVHPSAENIAIRGFRPRIHDLAAEIFGA
jgi:CubicO group peptidase (beta-lactamase class C family)